jgi:hypothetical protein
MSMPGFAYGPMRRFAPAAATRIVHMFDSSRVEGMAV